jgi:hypothetical protein
MKEPLAGVFYYLDGCSRHVPDCVPDPPPRHISLETEDYFKSGPHQFRSKAVHRDAGEAWYEETRNVRTDELR